MSFNFDMDVRRIHLNGLSSMLSSPSGEVGQYLNRIGRLIVAAAKAQVGVDTGRLRDAIHMVHHRAGVGQFLWIGADVDYAYAHHEGTSAHMQMRTNGQVMRFSRGGRQIYTHSVRHPGTQPNRFLSDQLHLVKR